MRNQSYTIKKKKKKYTAARQKVNKMKMKQRYFKTATVVY